MNASKEQFGIEITRQLKKRKLTQSGLAAFLGITPAAVCFLLKNKFRSSPAQFDRIMEYLHADAGEINYLRRLWFATQKNSVIQDNSAVDLFSIRCAKGISVEEVCSNTGILPERLHQLENKTGCKPTPGELALLKGYYGDASVGLDDSMGEDTRSFEGVAEEFAEELRSRTKQLPVLSPDVFSRVAKAGSLDKFLGPIPFNCISYQVDPRHFDRARAVLICDAEEIHFGFKGKIELVLAEFDPESADLLHLGRGNRGGVSLWQKMRRTWVYYGGEHPAPRMSNAWSLPVLEFHFTSAPPIKISSGKNK